ncbi:hypothetical protein J2127_001095 [Methanococcus voltae]|uniref:transglutaminase-like domain-containing protein n=1 Tax=Methanococcus voltae TaxID=2188 RepID=UPI001AE70586|nr:transglutaminase-like domain-containing protein [Methanococcus voltae]MBP2143926.1 hypothetical protein [Methanococcus voltae]
MYHGEYEKVKTLIERELAYNGSSGSMNMYYAYIEYLNGNHESSKEYIENILDSGNRLYDDDEYVEYIISNSKDKKPEFKNFYDDILSSKIYKQDVKQIEDEIDNYYIKKQNDKVIELIDILLNSENYAKYIDVKYYQDFKNNLKGYSINQEIQESVDDNFDEEWDDYKYMELDEKTDGKLIRKKEDTTKSINNENNDFYLKNQNYKDNNKFFKSKKSKTDDKNKIKNNKQNKNNTLKRNNNCNKKISKNNTKNKSNKINNIFSIKNVGLLSIIVLVGLIVLNQNAIMSMFQNQDSTGYVLPKEEIYGYYDDYDNNNIIDMYDYSTALLQPKYLKEIPKLTYLQSNNVLETTVNLANFQAKNFEYNQSRANQEDYGRPYTPFEMYKLKSGVCSDYTLFSCAYLLNAEYGAYIVELEEYGGEGHSFTAIEYGNNYYAIDQVNTIFNLGNYLSKYNIENLRIYKLELKNNETIVSKVQDTKDMTKKRYITPYMLNLATSNLNNDLGDKNINLDKNLTNKYLPSNYKSGEKINYYLEDLAPELKYNYYLIVENELEKHNGYKGIYTTFKSNVEDNYKEYPYILEINIGY